MKMTKTSVRCIALLLCMVLFTGITIIPVNAKIPTLETQAEAEDLILGSNQIKIKDYKEESMTLLGCFEAPETGKYSIAVTNSGSDQESINLLDEENFSTLIIDGKECYRHYVKCLEKVEFGNTSLNQGEKIYVYVNSSGRNRDLLAATVVIKQVKPKETTKLNKTKMQLKPSQKATLQLSNLKSNSKVIWVSSDKKIATVSSKGSVQAKNKGTAYIYAIANNKLYKCEVLVY